MTIPDNTLSAAPALDVFLASSNYPTTDLVSYTMGPIQVQDISKGINHIPWRARCIQGNVSLAAPNVPEYVFTSVRCISQVSLAFDQNARPLLAYLIEDALYIYWFDPFSLTYEHRLIDNEVTSVRIKIDDFRRTQVSNSQIILAYVKAGSLFTRVQSDRFNVPYLMESGVAPRLIEIGMNSGNRFQFLFEQNPFPVYEDPWPYGTI